MEATVNEPQQTMRPLSSITTLSEYLQTYGAQLAKKAITSLSPLHVPGVDSIPTFAEYRRKPYEAQAHLAVAAGKMFDAYGAGFIVGEMGTGKTLSSIIAVNEHAKHGRNIVNPGYRSLVVCPDHLVKKWKREIENTIPDVDVYRFDKWWDFLELVGKPNPHAAPRRWGRAERPTWIVMGRDQIKRNCTKRGVNATKRFEVEYEKPAYRPWDAPAEPEPAVPRFELRSVCPKCGAVPTVKGEPIGTDALAKQSFFCSNLVMTEMPSGSGSDGLDRLVTSGGDYSGHFPHEHRKALPDTIISHAGKKWYVTECGEPLWQFKPSPYWWAPAKIIQKKMRKFAEYLVVDEAHEQQSETSNQSMALGKVLASTRYALALTGTFINGKADSLFPLFMRMCVKDLQARGFDWGDSEEFAEKYGCRDRIVRSTQTVSEFTGHNATRGMGKRKAGTRDSKKTRPGIMPTLFSDIVISKTIFLKLEQFVDYLPGYAEIPMGFDLPPDIQNAYNFLQETLKEVNGELLSAGCMKLMGTMLHTLLGYPDSPWDWPSAFPGEVDEKGQPYHAVGWWKIKDLLTKDSFVGVVTPEVFDESRILPKEQALIDLCKEHTKQGDQTWVYCYMTQKKDVQPRLQRLLTEAGLRVGINIDPDSVEQRVGILRTGETAVVDREDWIEQNGYKYDVVLSHPKMVATGMDLFSFDSGNHNFNRLIFYQCGYELSILRQASRRSWRLGQPKDCTVHFLYYQGTSQELAVNLMGLKLGAATMLEEGKISDEGLAAMGGGGDERAALANALGSVVDPADIKRNWSRVQSRPKGALTMEQINHQRKIEGHPDIRMGDTSEEAMLKKPEEIFPKPKKENIVRGGQRVGKTFDVKVDDDDSDLAEAVKKMREWQAKQSAGPKLHVPEEDTITSMFKALQKKASSDDWDW